MSNLLIAFIFFSQSVLTLTEDVDPALTRIALRESESRRKLSFWDDLEDKFFEDIFGGWFGETVPGGSNTYDNIEEIQGHGIEALRGLTAEDLKNLIQKASECFTGCLFDFNVHGCMPGGDGSCYIAYGGDCLAVDATIGISSSHEFEHATERTNDEGVLEQMDTDTGLTLMGGASARVQTNARVILELDNSPKVRVQIASPHIDIDAKIQIDFDGDVTINARDKKISLAPERVVLRRVFMAGPVPVLIAITVHPVAVFSMSGSASSSGTVTYTAEGELSFAQDMFWVDLDLTDFGSANNFDHITPIFAVDDGFQFNLEGQAGLEVSVNVGAEIAIKLYETVEVNLFPSVKSTFANNEYMNSCLG